MGGDPQNAGRLGWSTICAKLQSMGERVSSEELAHCFDVRHNEIHRIFLPDILRICRRDPTYRYFSDCSVTGNIKWLTLRFVTDRQHCRCWRSFPCTIHRTPPWPPKEQRSAQKARKFQCTHETLIAYLPTFSRRIQALTGDTSTTTMNGRKSLHPMQFAEEVLGFEDHRQARNHNNASDADSVASTSLFRGG